MKGDKPGMSRAEVHQFHFSQDNVATCRCGRWALAKIPMTAKRAQRLAKKYGIARLGPFAGTALSAGLPFTELTKDEALKSWGCHKEQSLERRKPYVTGTHVDQDAA